MASETRTEDENREAGVSMTLSVDVLDVDLPINEARDAVIQQNDLLLAGEIDFDKCRRQVAHNNYLLYALIRNQSDDGKLVDDWLANRGFAKKDVKSRRKAVRVARALWKGNDVDKRRISDEGNVLETAYRYFPRILNGGFPDPIQFSNWIDDCRGFDKIRRNQAPEEYGGPARKEKPMTAAERYEKRQREVKESNSILTIDVVPFGATPDQLVLFYGVAKGQQTSLRMACLLSSEGGLNVHALEAAKLCHQGKILATGSIENNIAIHLEANATTADDQIDQAAEATA